MMYTVPVQPEATTLPSPGYGLHYLDAADMLLRSQREGRSLGELSRLSGLPVPRVQERLRLAEMEEGLRFSLRRENVPERIAVLLLRLPDPLMRRRMLLRIVRERLCIRDAALLVEAARHRHTGQQTDLPRGQRVITLIRDPRPHHNAPKDIAGQMNAAGLRADFTERRSGHRMELTIAYSTRRRRAERRQSM